MTDKQFAYQIRLDALEMVHNSHASHIGSAFSVADIIAVLYNSVLRFNPKDPKWSQRDRFVLSKGHAGSALYAALAEKGFFSKSELIKEYCQNGSHYSGHISHKGVPGVEFSTGSLGHGVCVATGLALAGKMNQSDYHVFAVTGDGECDEGSFWETVLFANQYKLNNYTIIIDRNKMQAMGFCKDVMNTENLKDKISSFGLETVVIDGHNFVQLKKELESYGKETAKCIIAETTKGKGVSFMENQLLWHYRDPQGEFYDKAKKELEEELKNA